MRLIDFQLCADVGIPQSASRLINLRTSALNDAVSRELLADRREAPFRKLVVSMLPKDDSLDKVGVVNLGSIAEARVRVDEQRLLGDSTEFRSEIFRVCREAVARVEDGFHWNTAPLLAVLSLIESRPKLHLYQVGSRTFRKLGVVADVWFEISETDSKLWAEFRKRGVLTATVPIASNSVPAGLEFFFAFQKIEADANNLIFRNRFGDILATVGVPV